MFAHPDPRPLFLAPGVETSLLCVCACVVIHSVAAVYGAVATPSELTIVTDLVKRGPLRTLLTDKKKRESFTPEIRHRIIKDVATGMAYLSEQGVQHRNLHSHNVLITKEWGAKVRSCVCCG